MAERVSQGIVYSGPELARRRAQVRELGKREDIRQIKAAKTAASWLDPRIRQARTAGIKRHHDTDKYKQAKSAEQKKLWTDPDLRTSMIERMREANRTPETEGAPVREVT